MTKASLEGCWAKLDRADEQLRALHPEIQKWCQGSHGKPYEFGSEPEERDSWLISKYCNVRRPPLRFAVIVGEVIHDLRSSLDHLITQLVRLSNKRPYDGNYFPIFEREFTHPRLPNWEDDADKALQGVRRSFRAIVEDAQPYKRRRAMSKHQLLVLNNLWNIDKHRILHLMAVSISGKNIPQAVKLDLQGFSGVLFTCYLEPGPIENGADAIVLHIDRAPYGLPPHMQMTAQIPIEVGFGESQWGISDLQKIGVYIIRKVLNPYAPLFKEEPVRGHPLTKPIHPKRPKSPDERLFTPDPSETPFEVNGWKVWFDSGRLPSREPLWCFLSPGNVLAEMRAVGLTEAEFRLNVAHFSDLALSTATREHFEPRERESIAGWGYFPSRGIPEEE